MNIQTKARISSSGILAIGAASLAAFYKGKPLGIDSDFKATTDIATHPGATQDGTEVHSLKSIEGTINGKQVFGVVDGETVTFYDGPSMEVMMHGGLKRRGYHVKGNANARYDGSA
jgi:hypothetical protein